MDPHKPAHHRNGHRVGAHAVASGPECGVGGDEESVTDRQPASACTCGYSYAANDPAGVCPSCGKVRPLLVKGDDAVAVGEKTNTELWIAASWAAGWFRDALADAQHAKGDVDARRREIVFAVCCVESYLFEWTRGLVGPREIERYFPQGRRLGIREKWKQVLGELATDKKIPGAPSFGGSDWAEFVTLVEYRDGLIHASASRPTSPSNPGATPPVPPVDVLQDMEPGRPVRVVADLMRSLHTAVGSETPHWLVNP
jgi:hypothetical protein